MSRPNSPTFRELQASFETRSKPTTATTPTSTYRHRSVPEDSANMSTEKPSRAVPAIAQSIDSVLETPAAKPAVRPTAKLRPSWIGPPRPERPTTPGAPAMKQHVNVEYSSPGLKPPVYIFTDLGEPQWEAVEMQAEKKDGGEYKFSKAFDVDEGEYQFKFRLGPGDWWACDDSRPTVDDGMGNKNNSLVVKAPEPKLPQPDSNIISPPPTPKPLSTVIPEKLPQLPSIMTPAPHEIAAPTPLVKHEAFIPTKGSETQQTPEREVQDPLSAERCPDDDNAPLMKHETFDSNDDDNDKFGFRDNDSLSSSDSEDENSQSPLLRHETLSLHSHEQEHAPLFHHESIALGYDHPEHAQQHANAHSHGPPEADPNDPTLEHFPTDHAGIMEKIRRASLSIVTDLSHDLDHNNGHHSPQSPKSPHSQALCSSPSLPSVHEADEAEEDLARIRRVEERQLEKEEESGDEMDPLRSGEPEDADFEPRVQPEIVEIKQTIVVEVIDRRKSRVEQMVEKAGGRNSVLVIVFGIIVAAVGFIAVRYL